MKVGLTRFTNDLDVGYERKRRVEAGCRNLGLSNCKAEAVALDVETGGLREELGSFVPQSLQDLANKQLYAPTSKPAEILLGTPKEDKERCVHFCYLFFTHGHRKQPFLNIAMCKILLLTQEPALLSGLRTLVLSRFPAISPCPATPLPQLDW